MPFRELSTPAKPSISRKLLKKESSFALAAVKRNVLSTREVYIKER
jgi:hypothetical protein